MKVKVKMSAAPQEVPVTGEFIKLDSFLKLVSAVSTGGEAKLRISGGEITVNGEECLMRGKKLHNGDIVRMGQHRWLVKTEEE